MSNITVYCVLSNCFQSVFCHLAIMAAVDLGNCLSLPDFISLGIRQIWELMLHFRWHSVSRPLTRSLRFPLTVTSNGGLIIAIFDNARWLLFDDQHLCMLHLVCFSIAKSRVIRLAALCCTLVRFLHLGPCLLAVQVQNWTEIPNRFVPAFLMRHQADVLIWLSQLGSCTLYRIYSGE